MQRGTEGELVGPDPKEKQARENRKGITMSTAASEGADDGRSRDHIPFEPLVEQLARVLKRGAVAVAMDDIRSFYRDAGFEEHSMSFLGVEESWT